MIKIMWFYKNVTLTAIVILSVIIYVQEIFILSLHNLHVK